MRIALLSLPVIGQHQAAPLEKLAKPRPALLDAWVPHLDALGLRTAVEKWRQKQRGTDYTTGPPDLADLPAGGEALSGPAFTGVAPGPVPAVDSWSEPFYSAD